MAAEAADAHGSAARRGITPRSGGAAAPTQDKPPFVLRLKPKDGGPTKRVTLDAEFDPATMTQVMRDRPEPKQRAPRNEQLNKEERKQQASPPLPSLRQSSDEFDDDVNGQMRAGRREQ